MSKLNSATHAVIKSTKFLICSAYIQAERIIVIYAITEQCMGTLHGFAYFSARE